MTRTDEEIIDLAREYNVGDLNLGYTQETRQRADHLVNKDALRNNVLPLMVINRSNPERNYVFVWCPLDESDYARQYVNDCKRDGYEVVAESEWIINEDGWVWHKPEKWRFRWSVTRLLVNDHDEFLMYRDEDKWLAQRERYDRFNEDRINGRYEDTVNNSARIAHDKGLGVEVSATAGGKDMSIKPSSRRTVS